MVSCRHAVVPRLNETSVSQRASEKWGERWRTSSSRGAGGGERPESTREHPTLLSLSPARPSRNIVILGIFVVPAKKKGSNVRWKRPRRPNLSFKEGASVVRVVGAIETRGRIRFPFRRLEIVPFAGEAGVEQASRTIKAKRCKGKRKGKRKRE